jgi:hypothetical protein
VETLFRTQYDVDVMLYNPVSVSSRKEDPRYAAPANRPYSYTTRRPHL